MVDFIDKAKILLLLDEADDIVSALYRQGANKDYKCRSLREKLKAVETELQNIRQNDDYALWILEEGYYNIYEGVKPDKYICNKCGCIEYRKSRFCPNCGRTMKEDDPNY